MGLSPPGRVCFWAPVCPSPTPEGLHPRSFGASAVQGNETGSCGAPPFPPPPRSLSTQPPAQSAEELHAGRHRAPRRPQALQGPPLPSFLLPTPLSSVLVLPPRLRPLLSLLFFSAERFLPTRSQDVLLPCALHPGVPGSPGLGLSDSPGSCGCTACGCALRDPWSWVSVNGHVWVSEGPWVCGAPGLWVFASVNLWMCSLTVLGTCESWYPGRCGSNLSPSWLPVSGGKKTNLIFCSRFLIFIKHLLCGKPYSGHWGIEQ